MAENDPLLIELGVEELPAGSVYPLAEFLGAELFKSLSSAGLASQEPIVYATPRRLAASFPGIAARQQDRQIQKRGPAIKAAFDESGEPTKALLGFARSCGAEVSALSKLETDKGTWMVFDTVESGKSVGEVVAEALPQLIKQMPMPKRMRWSDRADEFLRPVQWLLALHGEQTLDIELLGLSSGRSTQGHRFHAPESIELRHADDYETVLQNAKVIASFEKRRTIIKDQVEREAKAAGGVVDLDSDLLDEVTALVEWPVAISGSYETEFLEMPREAIVQTMEDNQRYFALLDSSGELLPGFITVANLESKNPQSVKEGNERVIRPRFKDTMFFWESDSKRKLAEFRPGLEKVLFQEKLGTVADKVERLSVLAASVAHAVGADESQCREAAQLAKCDLLTATVTELPKMQGIAGRYLAKAEGYPDSLCAALEEQYWPKGAGGSLPESAVGRALSIAEKVDTLTGIYGIGLKPTGTRDPFGLRRAAVGLLRLLIECDIELDLSELIARSAQGFAGKLDADFKPETVVDYVLDRLKGYYQEQGISGDVVDAVLASGSTNPLDIHHRITAVSSFRSTPAASSIAAANKRIRNILKKIETGVPETVEDKLLSESAEKELAGVLINLEAEIEPLFNSGDYQKAMTSTAKLHQPVDDFFNDVMVMVDDEAIRNNRLALLNRVGKLCSRTADLSRLQIESSS